MLDRGLGDVLATTKAHLQRLENLQVRTVRDLLTYFPRTYNDSSSFTRVADVRLNEVNTVKVTIESIFTIATKFGKKIVQAVVSDESGSLAVAWFNQSHLTKMLFKGMQVILSGKLKLSFNRPTLQSPTFEVVKRGVEQIHAGRIVPVYHETEGLTSKWLREKIKPLLDDCLRGFEEHLVAEVRMKYDLMGLREAIFAVHFPKDSAELQRARYRLAFDELLEIQLRALEKKEYWQEVEEKYQRPISGFEDLVVECLSALPFELTGAQKRVLAEIEGDLARPRPMNRLVQGDVGSGKTIVAALAALKVAKNGYQVAVMAPTEILAKQHYRSFVDLLTPFGLNVQFIAGSSTAKQKEDLKRQLLGGTADVVIGTHALIQDGVAFRDLGLAIIDEQHRFGVRQREILKEAGSPHLLTMTATPIPRTLAITLYGDQDLSVIDEMPANRQEILTRVVPEKKRLDAYRWIEDQVKKGRQAFVICPLIDESDTLEVKSVLDEYVNLSEHIFPELRVAFLHGKLKQDEKDTIMADFKERRLDILVSTSVIEVGIDVPNASIMLIEGAERFGLSQLHQFRGRVGRGEHQSYCFLFTSPGVTSENVRLKAMEKYASGFKLSEIDLQLRGPGEVYGIKQSGIPDLKMANLADTEMVKLARECAMEIRGEGEKEGRN